VSEKQGGISYFNILTKIAAFLTVNLYTRTRYIDDKVFYAFMVIAHNSKSHEIVRSYFDTFPLYSSKYLAYKDWCRVQDLRKGGKILTREGVVEIESVKAQFNSKRKLFDFSGASEAATLRVASLGRSSRFFNFIICIFYTYIVLFLYIYIYIYIYIKNLIFSV